MRPRPKKRPLQHRDCLLEVQSPPEVAIFCSGDASMVVEDGRNILVAPFGCQIINFSETPDNFGGQTTFQPLSTIPLHRENQIFI